MMGGMGLFDDDQSEDEDRDEEGDDQGYNEDSPNLEAGWYATSTTARRITTKTTLGTLIPGMPKPSMGGDYT